jgi:hypothetical protein
MKGEEVYLVRLGKELMCAARRGKRATEGAARDCHADGGVHGSVVEKQGRERCCCHTGPCTWSTMDQEGEGQVNSVHHGPSLRFTTPHRTVHCEPLPHGPKPSLNLGCMWTQP